MNLQNIKELTFLNEEELKNTDGGLFGVALAACGAPGSLWGWVILLEKMQRKGVSSAA